MDREVNPSGVTCKLCGEAFSMPDEDEGVTNLPRVLLCGHIYCTSCLLSIQCDKVIRCPECQVESTISEDGVYGLQEDSRIIGLIYTARMNKTKRTKNRRRNKSTTSPDMNANTEDMEQSATIMEVDRRVDEALIQAAENLAKLEHIHENLTTGPEEQLKMERSRLEKEIKQSADKAVHAVQKWRDMQLNQMGKLEDKFSSKAQMRCVQERIKALEIAIQMAKEVRRIPFLEQYCILDKVLETLQTPVDNQTFDMQCITVGSGMSCVFRSESLNQSLSLSLKMEVSSPKGLSKSPLKGHQLGRSTPKPSRQNEEGMHLKCSPPSRSKPPSPQRKAKGSPESNGVPSPSPRPRRRLNVSHHNSASDLKTQDVIIEELLEEGPENAPPPTGPELANTKRRFHRTRNHPFGNKRNVNQWVVVTHIVNPSHFFVRYVADKRANEALLKKINFFCCEDSCQLSPSDIVETGFMIFVKWKEGLWCRAIVEEVLQNGCVEAVKSCPVDLLASIKIFLLDYGPTKTITVQSEEGSAESSLNFVNNNLRKMSHSAKVEMHHFAPQVIRCSLKDLVPYDLITGWSELAQIEFHNVVGSAAVDMRVLSQDRDSLMVDLRKAPMDQSSDLPISIREYLVFIEVARFYSPVTLDTKPLTYYPPVYPKMNRELNAVVSHINNPADFYIQLVDNMESLLLSNKLQECYNATSMAGSDDLTVFCPVIGQAYVARYEGKLWYRAHVLGHPGARKVEVRYVDFGNESIVSVSDLRKIKDEFFALPSMAIHCCLSNVIPLDGESWSDACTKRFISLAHQKLVTIIATETSRKSEPLPIRLFESELHGALANIAELLVNEELASFKRGKGNSGRLKSKDAAVSGNESAIWDPPLEQGWVAVDGNAANQEITKEQKEEPLEFEPQLKLPAQLDDLKVRVSHVNSPSSFFVQLTQSDPQLKRVCELVREECAPMEPQDVVWKADMYCAAHSNGVWERGRICSDVTSSNIAEVMRCDHGNTVKLHVSNLRPLPTSLMGSFALECTLTDIRPAGGRSTWTATACDLMSYYLTGASATMTIKNLTDEQPVPVTLFCSNKMGRVVSLADFLVNEGLALRERKLRNCVAENPVQTDATSPVTETHHEPEEDKQITHPAPSVIPEPAAVSHVSFSNPPKAAPRTIMSAEKVKTHLYHPPELPCLGHVQIIVSAIGEDGLIYGRTQNAGCQLEQLRERIQQNMKTLPRQKPYTWKSVQGCVIIGSDMLWHRGQLLEVLGGNIKVQYVDYGLVENIPAVHVYPTLLCDDVPQLCMSCQLHNINPVGGWWQQDAVALLQEILLNRSVDIQVMKLPTDPRGPLTVELFLDGLNLNRILCHLEHASMTASTQQMGHAVTLPPSLDVWDISSEGLMHPEELMPGAFVYPCLPQSGEKFPVRVKHLLTPNELFLWPLEGTVDVKVDGESLDEALTRINANTSSLPQLANFPQGGPCLAEYSDGKFYRAKLIKFISMEPAMILVQHIDFGSDDTLPTSKLRQIPTELLRFPIQALKVKVAGFKAPRQNTLEDTLPYSPGWSVKAVLLMIELLHNNITASVVAHEPELTVLLYDEDGAFVHQPLLCSGLAEVD